MQGKNSRNTYMGACESLKNIRTCMNRVKLCKTGQITTRKLGAGQVSTTHTGLGITYITAR